MKKTMFMNAAKALSAVALALCCGCASVHIATDFSGVKVEDGLTPIETVEITNTGWLLFTCIPIASGNVNHPNSVSTKFFSRTVTLDNNIKLLSGEMARVKASKMANLTSRYTDENILFVLLKRRAYHTSAVLLGD